MDRMDKFDRDYLQTYFILTGGGTIIAINCSSRRHVSIMLI